MTIEATLEHIAQSLEQIVAIMSNQPKQASLPLASPPAPQPVPAPIPAAVEVPAVPVPAVPLPVPAAAPAPTGAPFADAKGLTEYCMAKYKELGPVKGGMIQNTLIELGCANIHQLPAEKYGEFYTKVEAL